MPRPCCGRSPRQASHSASTTRQQQQEQRAFALIAGGGARFLAALHHHLAGAVTQAPFPSRPFWRDHELELVEVKLNLAGHRSKYPVIEQRYLAGPARRLKAR